ncbi:MAG TPA: energy transducer TonB, partial [Steroidobacteraceae bacterium]|nr:energy transducer TonB [Steroidobacteraceae bacterium]
MHPVDSLEGALEVMARGRRAQLLVIDARDVADVRDVVDTARAAAPGAVMLVFAAGAAEKQLGTSLGGSNVFAVLPMPLDPRKTQAVVEGALAEAVARCAPAAAANPLASLRSELSVDTFEPQPAAVSGRSGRGSKPPLPVFVAAGVTVLALAGGAAWYFSGHGNTTAPAPAPLATTPPSAPPAAGEQAAAAAEAPVAAPSAETLIVHGKVDELLEKARLAMKERRFTEPAGDNALLFYRSAVAADPTSAEGRDGLQRVAAVLASRFEEAMTGGRLEEAAQSLANFKSAAPGDARLVAFEQRLYAAEVSKALNDGNLERAAQYVRQAQQSTAIPAAEIARWRADIARRQDDAKVQRLAGLVEERIREGRLTDSDDSARTHLLQLQAAAPANASTQRVTRELIAADLRKAREAALARNAVEQERWLAEARAVGMKPAEAAAFQREMASSRQKALQADNDRLAQLARERLRDGHLTDPAQDSAAGYLTQLQAADAGSAALADVSRDLAGKLLERARSAVLAGRPADADLAQARRWGADPKDIAAVQQLQTPRSRGAAIDPAALIANLKRVRAVAPEYPPAAMAQKIAGSVTLEYNVDIRGEPRDIHVVEATPPGVFDQAA